MAGHTLWVSPKKYRHPAGLSGTSV
jgi:hypothetical protein